MAKNPPANAGDLRDTGSVPGSGRPLKRKWQLIPVILLEEPHGQRSWVGSMSPRDLKESDTTEVAAHSTSPGTAPSEQSLFCFLLGHHCQPFPVNSSPPCYHHCTDCLLPFSLLLLCPSRTPWLITAITLSDILSFFVLESFCHISLMKPQLETSFILYFYTCAVE